jgi:hypothetical protein
MQLDCEWNIKENRPLTHKEYVDGEAHAKATWFFGHENNLAVCDECAKLAKLTKYKIRHRIEKEAA